MPNMIERKEGWIEANIMACPVTQTGPRQANTLQRAVNCWFCSPFRESESLSRWSSSFGRSALACPASRCPPLPQTGGAWRSRVSMPRCSCSQTSPEGTVGDERPQLPRQQWLEESWSPGSGNHLDRELGVFHSSPTLHSSNCSFPVSPDKQQRN